jgi:hypothetical protein
VEFLSLRNNRNSSFTSPLTSGRPQPTAGLSPLHESAKLTGVGEGEPPLAARKGGRSTTARIVVALIFLLTASIACGFGGDGGVEATAQAISDSLNQTATAEAQVEVEEQAAEEAANAEATAQAEAAAATIAAEEAQAAEEAAATAAAEEPIRAELSTYGVDPSEGRLGWIHPPVTLDIEGYLVSDSANQYAATVAADFVMASDITWNTSTGISGCGFALRSDGNEEAPNQFMVLATRAGNGTIFFFEQADGDVSRQENVATGGIDDSFGWQNDTTNRIAVVGRGPTISVYTNGVLIKDFDASAYDKGFVAMVALSESGRTVCEFNNTWLWVIQ